MKDVLIKSMEAMDDEMYDLFTNNPEEIYDGCTAVWLVHDVKRNNFHVANLGDSRCVISQGRKKIFMTRDHKPSNDDESDRIYSFGGYVQDDRVCGNLALSRAFGDFEYKKRPYKMQNRLGCKGDLVSRIPTVSHISSDNFNFTAKNDSPVKNPNPVDKADSINIIIACDGVFDVFTADEADFDDPYSNFYGFKEGGTIQDLIDFVDLNLMEE